MAAIAVSQFLYLLDDAFDGSEWHSLLGNLRSVPPDLWRSAPSGGRRTIRDIVQHVGGCKFMYENHAFGDATLRWDHPLVDGVGVLESISSAVEWLSEGQHRLRESVASLDDAELLRPRRTNWGELRGTRWIIAVMIQHDLYHAGEINHARALLQGADRWEYDQS